MNNYSQEHYDNEDRIDEILAFQVSFKDIRNRCASDDASQMIRSVLLQHSDDVKFHCDLDFWDKIQIVITHRQFKFKVSNSSILLHIPCTCTTQQFLEYISLVQCEYQRTIDEFEICCSYIS